MVKRIHAGDRLFDYTVHAILVFTLLVVLYPLYFIVIASISDPTSVYSGKVWLIPDNLSFEGYRRVFTDESIWIGYRNSIIYLITGTLAGLFVTIPGAYALSRKDLPGRRSIMLILIFTMFFSGGLIPKYLVVKNLGMINKIWAMIIPDAVSVWYLIIARTFFQETIPDELHDAGKIDGCSDFKFFFLAVLPLSSTILAVISLFYGVWHWNAFFSALIYLRSEKLYPLQLVLRQILLENEAAEDMITDVAAIAQQQRIADLIKYGVIIVASVPMLVLYPFLQKYFVKGVLVGSIKG